MTIRPLPRHRLGPAGVSLVELLIVMAVVGVVTTGMYSLFLTTSQTYSEQAVNGRMLQNATTAMKRITQDIRGGGTFYVPACAGLPTGAPPTAIAVGSTASSLTIVTMLDDPSTRTELASSQPRTNATIGVRSVTGWSGSGTEVAYLTDGVQCTRFTVTALVTGANPGLTHTPANDTYLTGGSAYIYPVTTSMVYRVPASQTTITYDLDTSDATTPWLRRNNQRYAPDIQSVSFGYLDGSGAAVGAPVTAANAASIRAVTVTLRVRGDTTDASVPGGRRNQWLTSTVQLRNFGS